MVVITSKCLIGGEVTLFRTTKAAEAYDCMAELTALADVSTSSIALVTAINKGSFSWKAAGGESLELKTRPVRNFYPCLLWCIEVTAIPIIPL